MGKNLVCCGTNDEVIEISTEFEPLIDFPYYAYGSVSHFMEPIDN